MMHVLEKPEVLRYNLCGTQSTKRSASCVRYGLRGTMRYEYRASKEAFDTDPPGDRQHSCHSSLLAHLAPGGHLGRGSDRIGLWCTLALRPRCEPSSINRFVVQAVAIARS